MIFLKKFNSSVIIRKNTMNQINIHSSLNDMNLFHKRLIFFTCLTLHLFIVFYQLKLPMNVFLKTTFMLMEKAFLIQMILVLNVIVKPLKSSAMSTNVMKKVVMIHFDPVAVKAVLVRTFFK